MAEHISAKTLDRVLHAIPPGGVPLRVLEAQLGLRRQLLYVAHRELIYAGKILTARIVGEGSPRCELWMFTEMAARDAAVAKARAATKAKRNAREKARSAARKLARSQVSEAQKQKAAQEAEARKKIRQALKAEADARRRIQRAAEKEARRIEREAQKAERAKQKKASKKHERLPGAKQVRTAEAHASRRYSEEEAAELKRSNWAKTDARIPEGLQVKVYPAPKDTRYTVADPDAFRGEFSRAGIGRYTAEREAA